MTPQETVVLARYVRALCPQQKFDEYTPDAWHDVLSDYPLTDARTAAAAVARRQPFISPAEIIEEIRQQRTSNVREIHGAGQAAEVPDADPDDVPAYLAALRAQRTRAADGMELKPRPMKQLLAGVGHTVPTKEQPAQTALDVPCPHCEAPALRACRSGNGRRLGVYHPSRQEAARTNTSKETA